MRKAIIELNFITPEEASKKWCPDVRNLYLSEGEMKHAVATAYNADRNHNKCISTNCQFWLFTGDGRGCCGRSGAASLLTYLPEAKEALQFFPPSSPRT